ISMMYLVYTALLALNVSADILNAFITVGESVEVTNKIMAGKAESAYTIFENAYNGNPGKVGENWAKAQEVRKKTKVMLDYIDNMKYELIAVSEGLEGGAAEAKKRFEQEGFGMIEKKDNYDGPTNYFLAGTEDGSAGKAIEFRKKIEAYQADILKYIQNEGYKKQFKKYLIKTEGTWNDASGEPKNWQMYNFYHTILTADIVLLNKFKSEIMNMEMDLVNHLYSQISADDFKFDQVTARVLPKSTYIIQGGQYEADVIVAAYDSKSELTGEVRGQNLVGDSGMLKLKFGAGALGEQKYKGTVYVKKETGSVPYEFEGEYFVAAPSATVSPTNLQLFYIGIPNPISVSVPGASLKDITVTVSGAGATLDKVSDGQYTVTPKKQGERVKVHVRAKIAGKEMDMGVAEFRTKNIPAPEALVGNQKDGRIEKSVLKGIGGIIIDKGGFDFPVKYKVASYNILLLQNGDVVKEAAITGDKFTPDILSGIDKLRRGAKVLIDNIRAVGPTGTVTTANTSIILTIK
ncbi:MAG: gliding motility protein GldM, partial [Bacteroidales bacterium]|nr:gliding motility protein GldM [Bacteroidales bacterium]